MTVSTDPFFLTANGPQLSPQQFPVTPTGSTYPRNMSDWMWGIDKVDTFNLNPYTLRNWRASIANVRAGTARARLVLLGDSTTVGAGSGASGNVHLNGAFAKAYPRGLGSLLNSYYAPVSDNSFFNDQNVAAQSVGYGSYDTRVSLGSHWGTAVLSYAGNVFKFTSGSGAGTLAFTPVGAFDTLQIWYLQQPAQGSFAVNVDGGASLGTINSAGTASLLTQSYTVTKGTHTVNMVANNDGNLFILGCLCWDSTTPAIDLIQAGTYGATAQSFNTIGNIWSSLTVQPQLSPDLTVVCLTINDSNTGTDLFTYKVNMQAVITAALSTGDCVLMVGAPSNTPQATTGILQRYIDVLRQLALANSIGMIDLSIRWTSYAVTNPLMPYFDTVHPAAIGYQDIAYAVFSGISV